VSTKTNYLGPYGGGMLAGVVALSLTTGIAALEEKEVKGSANIISTRIISLGGEERHTSICSKFGMLVLTLDT